LIAYGYFNDKRIKEIILTDEKGNDQKSRRKNQIAAYSEKEKQIVILKDFMMLKLNSKMIHTA